MAKPRASRTILILSQVYVPDPAAVGQHMADLAATLAERGWRVLVLTASRGYEDPSIRFPFRERRRGVEIRRLPFSSFGKRSMALRLVAAASFMTQCFLRGLFVRRLSTVVVSTSPPLSATAGLAISVLRRASLKFFASDLNPDQLIALGRLEPDSLTARLLNALTRPVLRHAADVVALDHFMAERLHAKLDSPARTHVIAPWPLEDQLEEIEHRDNPFRRDHRLEDRFVFMYSGNHGLTTPVSAVVEAARRLEGEERLLFAFVGGGFGKTEVERAIAERGATNLLSLPYQPLSELRFSLSAADVHVVTMREDTVGIIHPSKVYGAMRVARPLLVIAPSPSHLTELVERFRIGWAVANGDVDGLVTTIRTILDTDPEELAEMGRRASEAVATHYSKSYLCGQVADVFEPAASPSPQ